MNINDLYAAAEEAEDTSFGDLLGPVELPSGTDVLAEIVYSKAGRTKKDAPSWTNKLRVLEGEHEGGEFFDSIYLSANNTDGGHSYNKRQFAKLSATGLGAQFFSTNPSTEAIAKAISNKVKVIVHIKWQTPDGYDTLAEAMEAGERIFGEHTWSPVGGASGSGGGASTPAGFKAM